MAHPSIQGRFIWQELTSGDPAAAQAFYSKVVGWKSEAAAQNSDYTLFSNASGPMAGLLLLPETARQMGSRPQWLPYVGSLDVDATVVQIERLGGRSLRPVQQMEDVGRFAIVADPQGAPFAVFKPAYDAPASSGEPKRGEFSWMELWTTDGEAAFAFYRELFGWQDLQRMDMGPMGTYLIFGDHGVQRGGMMRTTHLDAGPHWLPYATVPDANAAAERARAAGGRVANGPMDVPGGGRVVQLLDTGGVLFAVYAPPSSPATTVQRASAAKKTAPNPAARPARRAVKKTTRPAPRRGKVRRTAKASKTTRAKKATPRAAPKRAAKRTKPQPARRASAKRAKTPARRKK